MANILITWREIESGDFPNHCMTCGQRGAELVQRRVGTVSLGFMCTIHRWIDVYLPFCPQHRTRSLFAWFQVDAARFTDDGVWMKNLAPEFVDALFARREKMERRRRRFHRTLEEIADAIDDPVAAEEARASRRADRGRDESDDEPEPRPRRPPARPATNWLLPTLMIGSFLGVMFLMCGGFVTLAVLGSRAQPQPAPGPAFHDPLGPRPGFGRDPFGPPPRFGPEPRRPPFGPQGPGRW
jgi:hypothetical protein